MAEGAWGIGNAWKKVKESEGGVYERSRRRGLWRARQIKREKERDVWKPVQMNQKACGGKEALEGAPEAERGVGDYVNR